MKSKGQKTEEWSNFWEGLTPESEIQMWDYYGLRPWILKYTPRFGKVIEAGCGLGRYNFYLSRFGIDTEGLDFEKKTVDFLNSWKLENGFTNCNFVEGDVTSLPYDDSILSGYISLGVVEHFIEGPQKPLKEALRVLRPGGIAIITTPAPSWSKFYFKTKNIIKDNLKKVFLKKLNKREFFQYEYSSKKLKNFIEKQGFYISRTQSADLLFTFTEFGGFTDKFIKKNSFGYNISHLLENSFLSFLGAQSVVIAIKKSEIMHCFLCGELSAKYDSLNNYDVPICEKCNSKKNSHFYKKLKQVEYHSKYIVSPEKEKVIKKECHYCKTSYRSDALFENYGFNKNICPQCLLNTDRNIEISNTSIQPIWRNRTGEKKN